MLSIFDDAFATAEVIWEETAPAFEVTAPATEVAAEPAAPACDDPAATAEVIADETAATSEDAAEATPPTAEDAAPIALSIALPCAETAATAESRARTMALSQSILADGRCSILTWRFPSLLY